MGPPREATDAAPLSSGGSGSGSVRRALPALKHLAPYAPPVMLVVVAAWIGRRLWFFSDDWNIFAGYHSGNLTEAFNGHLSLVPAGIYQVLFHTAGVGSYTPYRMAGLLSLAILGFQVARWTTSWVGPTVATVAVAAVMWNSAGATNVMFPFLMNFSLPIAALLAIWWHLDRIAASPAAPAAPDDSESRRRPDRHLVAIALWLALALATSGLGVMTAGAVAVELLLRRAPWRQWLTWAVPVALWGVWWLGNRESNEISTDLTAVIPYALRMLLAGTTSVAAGWRPLGVLLAVVLAVCTVTVTIRRRRLDPRVAAALCAALAFAGLTSLTRQDTVVPIPPDELRYGWTVGAYLVLAAVALIHASTEPGGRPSPSDPDGEVPVPAPARRSAALSVAVLVGAAVVVAAGAVRLTDGMRDWADQVADAAPGLRSNIYATEALGAPRTPTDAVIGPLSYVPVSAQDYLDAVAEIGSPLQDAGLSDIGGRHEQRVEADKLLFAGLGIAPPVPSGAEVAPDASDGCGVEAEVLPGDRVQVFAGDAVPRDVALTLGRFAEPGFVLGIPDGSSSIALPEDAPLGTTAVVPYRLTAPLGALICAP